VAFGGGITPNAATLANDRILTLAAWDFADKGPVLASSLELRIDSVTNARLSFQKTGYQHLWSSCLHFALRELLDPA
jgi:hypothetical protein